MHMKLALLATALACTAAPVRADTVCEWMEFAEVIQAAAGPNAPSTRPGEHDRAITQTALAMFEAVNAIDRRYRTYLDVPAADRAASQDAAAATAAYRVLLAHYPAQKTALEENHMIALQAVADEKARAAGQAVGEAAAALALKAGQLDPSITLSPYRPRTQAGVWVPTQLPVFAPYSIAFKPWILPRVDAVRPAPPPPMTSAQWARDYDEVKRVGGKISSERTPLETLMARYRITPNMMPTMRLAADAPGRRPVQNARMFAMSSMILDDALMATAEAKLYYNFWRPVTAIRNGTDDGNPETVADPAWEPLIATPNHPEYPCGHCTIAGAVGEYMTAEVGAKPPAGVKVSSRSIANSAVQSLPSWDEWVRQVNYSRTLGGVHYRFSNEAGEQVGRAVARMALANIMQPLRKRGRR